MNLKSLADHLEMEEEELAEMMDLFLKRSAADIDEFQAALAAGDSLRAAEAAHSIRGASVNLGLSEIVETAREMETEARRNHLDRGPEMVEVLRQKMADLEKSCSGRV